MHNPDKSRALCVIATTSYWTLRVVGWLAAVLFIAMFLLGIGVKIYKSWTGWPTLSEWAQGLGTILVGLLVVVVVIGIPAALYVWAKDYRSDC